MTAGDTSAQAEGRRGVRGSTALLSGRLLSMVFTITTQVVLVRALSKTEFGAFAFALALTSASRTLLSLGQGKSISRFLAMYDEARDERRLLGTLALAALTILLTSAVLFLVLVLGRELLAGALADEPEALSILLVLIVLAPMEALDEAFVGFFATMAKVRTIFLRRYVLTPGLRLAVVLVVLLVDGGPVLLAAGYVGASFIGLVFYFTYLRRVLRERTTSSPVRLREMVLPWRQVLPFAVPMLTTELVYLSMNTGSVLLLAAYWGAEQVAEYRAVFPAARLNQFVYASFATLYLPMAARLFARKDHIGIRDTYWHTAVLLTVLSFPVFALTGPFARATTVMLFGERYAESSTVLLLLSVGFYLNVCLGLNMLTLQVVGRVRFLLKVNVFIAALNLVLSAALVPVYGARGVAVANLTALVAQNLLNQWAMHRLTGALPDRRHARPYLLIVLCIAGLIGIELLLTPSFPIAFLVSAVTSLLLLFACRHALRLHDTFPELAKVPLLGRLAGS